MRRRATSLEDFWDRPLQELFQLLQATPAGLTTEEASRRLRLYGPNSLVRESRFAALLSFFGFFANPLVIILVVASGVSLALGEHVGGLIIIAIVLVQRAPEFLDGIPGSTRGGGDSEADCHNRCRDAGRTRTGTAHSRASPGRHRPPQSRRPCASGRPSYWR